MEKMQQAKNQGPSEIKGNRKRMFGQGWVRTKRGNKNINFIALNDGTVIHNHPRLWLRFAQFDEVC